MTSTLTYIKEWQQALQSEIMFLKKYGSQKFLLSNGVLLSNNNGLFSYYFQTSMSLRIPVGSQVRLEWGNRKQSGRILSSEGKGVFLALEQTIGDLIHEAFLFHDPWELLEQLILRFDEIKKSKQKRLKVKRLMDPSMPAKHPTTNIKSNIHELLLRSKYNPVTFVWGPPGTGKTYTLARVAANKYFQKKKVLILSQSNQAVDVILSELSAFIKKKDLFSDGDVVRYGANTSDVLANHEEVTTTKLIEKQDGDLIKNMEELKGERYHLKLDLARSFSKRDSHQLLEIEVKISKLLEKMRQKEIELVKDAFVVGTTLSKAASDPTIYENEFDVVILDEASMAHVPQVAFAATLGKRVIICGDFKQLPPIASARDPLVTKWLKEDIFHRAGVADLVNTGDLHPHLFLLREQRRMHPDISAFTNQFIYMSLVGDHPSVHTSRMRIVEQAPFPDHAAILLDTSYTGAHCINEKTSKSRFNLWQIFLSFQLIHESYIAGARSIGYVTPYRAQAHFMELLLEDLYKKELLTADIISATVHRFQGSERDIMIFDTVDGEPQDRVGMLLNGKDSERLINVAISRTKGKFINVSNQAFIQNHVYPSKIIRQLVQHQEKHQQKVKTKDIGKWIKNQHSKLQWMHALKLDKIFQDLQEAKSSIMISLPENTVLSDQWKERLWKRNERVNLTVISPHSWSELQPNQLFSEWSPFPFVIIDQHLVWLGVPFVDSTRIKPPFVAARLDSEMVTEYFLSQFINQ